MKAHWLAVTMCLTVADPGWMVAASRAETADPAAWRAMVSSNYLVEAQAEVMAATATNVTAESDAAGGCDGIINGQYGFHTDEAVDPWWQVDLGQVIALNRVMIWNRTESADRASQLQLKLSDNGREWRTAYEHDGKEFKGFADKKPLEIKLNNTRARYVRVQLPLPQGGFLHLDEVEVFGPDNPRLNLALKRPAAQVSQSRWSRNRLLATEPDWQKLTRSSLNYSERRLKELQQEGITLANSKAALEALKQELSGLSAHDFTPALYQKARAIQRPIALANPLLDFDTILFNKRAPASFNHMSDQYYGWWSKPGGGIYLLRNLRSDSPTVTCLTTAFTMRGSFLRPTLSYDAQKVLFAWCRYYPTLAKETNKLDKANVPGDAFYHLFEMNIDGTGLRQLTFGKYDDFDGRYLPDGRIVFLSTRRGQSLQVTKQTARASIVRPDQPDIYVRCGGGPERPVAVYTLHTMNVFGGDITPISPFEMFEWTPEIGHDGSILYSRWDYVDRDNMPYMGLWAMNPDGTNPRILYGNFTKAPHCAFEPKPVPNSHKIVFTGSAHHAQTMGTLVLLDPSVGTEGSEPITRLTPEVPMPEIESWPLTYYASPWPLSERFHLVAWGFEGASVEGPSSWERWHAVQRPDNGMALYLLDAAGSRELIYRDPEISSLEPIPVRPRPLPPTVASHVEWDQTKEGRFLLTDVYQGLRQTQPGSIKALRLVAVPPKTHPTMNFPPIGITKDDPGKCVLGTVPVEADGSAYFRAPAGVTLFFQALDERGVALQTMRSATHVQPGQTLSCAGCHEHRATAPQPRPSLAARREPSRITPGPVGSWPLRFDQLIQPILNKNCLNCHQPSVKNAVAAKLDLTPEKAYNTLIRYSKPSVRDQVRTGYDRGYSREGDGIAQRSLLLAHLHNPATACQKKPLNEAELERFIVWMDTYAQSSGSFSPAQERELENYRREWADLLAPRPAPTSKAVTLEENRAR